MTFKSLPKFTPPWLLYLAFSMGFSPAQGDQVPLKISGNCTLLMPLRNAIFRALMTLIFQRYFLAVTGFSCSSSPGPDSAPLKVRRVLGAVLGV